MDMLPDTGKRSEGLELHSTKNHFHPPREMRQTAFVYTTWRHLVARELAESCYSVPMPARPNLAST